MVVKMISDMSSKMSDPSVRDGAIKVVGETRTRKGPTTHSVSSHMHYPFYECVVSPPTCYSLIEETFRLGATGSEDIEVAQSPQLDKSLSAGGRAPNLPQG